MVIAARIFEEVTAEIGLTLDLGRVDNALVEESTLDQCQSCRGQADSELYPGKTFSSSDSEKS